MNAVEIPLIPPFAKGEATHSQRFHLTWALSLARLPRYGLAFAIRGYQAYISPIKGYRCAHHMLHGGWSCSEFGLRAAMRHGVIGFLRLIRRRFVACAQANIILQTKHGKDEPEYTEFPWQDCTHSKKIRDSCGNCCATLPWL
ncbi:MAG: membrane protein insertion efficiency factor YidD [Hydrogenophilales bacterium]|nr:membrane protein insertion efficiency factor YidD [Hydrogenophilales bacterium]